MLVDPEASAPRAGSLLLEDGRIADRLEAGAAIGDDWRRIDLAGRGIAPGFVDVHFHGSLVAAPAGQLGAALQRDARSLARTGTTAFLATGVAWPGPALLDFVSAAVARVAVADPEGAECLGLHLEGPWISARAPGAMSVECIRPFDPRADLEVLDRAEGLLRMVTLAPEVEGAPALLAELERRGVVAALGHTAAREFEIAEGVARGLRHVTHLFNAMGPMHHRAPGVPGVVLAEDRLTCDLICDGFHVHPAMLRLAARSLGERLLLVTDRLDLPGLAATDPGPGAPLRLPDGTLAGSQLSLDRAVGMLQQATGAGLCEAVAAAAFRPARLLGLEGERGSLRPGARADLAILDAAGAAVETWREGRQIWRFEDVIREPAAPAIRSAAPVRSRGVIGVDVGGSSIKAGLVDPASGALRSALRACPTPSPSSPDAIAAAVAQLVADLGAPGPVGCGLPSVVEDGRVWKPANLDPAWADVDGAALFSRATSRPVHVLNDADAAGLAELRFGAGRNHDGVVLVVTFGTGIGTSLIVAGRLVPNTELGHLPIHGTSAELHCSARARSEQGLSVEAWAERVGAYLRVLELLLPADLIIVGGGISEHADQFVPRLGLRCEVRAAQLGPEAGVVGAALAADDRFGLDAYVGG